MTRYIINCVLLILIICNGSISYAQKYKSYYDGPYIELDDEEVKVEWIEKGKYRKEKLPLTDTFQFNIQGLPKVDLSDLEFERNLPAAYDTVRKFVALSDIHGQHDLFLDLLVAQNVIDSSGHWIYDDGHLMIVGDIFDRGDKVTESLWFLFNLEKQAIRHGGLVHILLGNHELMILHGDVRYIHPKYQYTSQKLRTKYEDLFSPKTVLGQWLRAKNVSEKLNDIVFVHGGFSQDVLDKEKSISTINKIFKEKINNKKNIKARKDELIDLLYFKNGPLWYRGYANPNGFDVNTADKILNELDAESIVVGHTSMPKIITLHDNKIILVDSSIKFGKTGEVLVYETDSLYRGFLDGSKIVLGDESSKGLGSPFEYIYNLGDGDLTVVLNTDVDKLIDNKLNEEYQSSKLTAIHNKEFNRIWDIKLRARGNMRKKICELPPLKLNFPKSTLRYLGFDGYDKLNLVIPCEDSRTAQQGTYKEELVYRLYNLIDTISLRTRQVNIVIQDGKKTKYDFDGFFVEDDNDFAKRMGVEFLESGIISATATKRESYLKLIFFQYMICNTDWSYYGKHNLKIIKFPGQKRFLAIPHDFDYAGIVGMDYAIPNDRMPIDGVNQPYFRGIDVTEQEVEMMSEFYESKKNLIYESINNDEYLTSNSKKEMYNFIDKFYETIHDREVWDEKFINPQPLNKLKKD